MYKSHFRVGRLITVYGCRPRVGTSTMAALIAASMADRGEKTLLITTDSDIPDDAVSILSSDIETNSLDELVVLETSNGLTDENLKDYVTGLNDNLFYLRTSAKLTKLTKDPARTIDHIVEKACYDYAYVVLDLSSDSGSYAMPVLAKSDLVVLTIGQDHKSMMRARDIYHAGGFGDDHFLVPVMTGYVDGLFPSAKTVEKLTKADRLFQVDFSDRIANMAYDRDLANFVPKPTKRRFLNWGKDDAEESLAHAQLAELCDLIQQALHPKEMQEEKMGGVSDARA